ncbi:F-box/kelch-repeat protein At3g23880-like isoform X2 [Solanum pennellii]|uniref:F-box/kelch-repeat protein At3g23880-like isoform X2 n=1 Tax=Solanum pennellii TaxID=28526 RepID=A0ABM1HMT1_SOLPN|nr:F-box/kelch-repeat protein At3g23880-like isoform X2 [Solanum pennellii]
MAIKMPKCTCSRRRHAHLNLARRKANKSILKRIKANLLKFSNGGEEEAIKKFNLSRCQNQICKGKSLSNDQMEIHQVSTIHFQDEIMMDIFRRLPMQSLLRFKCVSKLWKSLIDDPYFKRTHYIHNRDNQKVLFAERFLSVDDDNYRFYTCSLSMVEDKQKLDCPTSCNSMDARIFCSCDGLVLIYVCSETDYEELLLWNPSTRESMLVPHPEFPIITYIYGMEYDATSEGYKILAINMNDESTNISVEFLSVKRNSSWRKIGYPTDIQRIRGFRDCGTYNLAFLHGAFHWLGKFARPMYMFGDCQVLLHFRRFGYFSSNFTTSGRPFDLCPECDTYKQGIVYAESFISPTSLLT